MKSIRSNRSWLAYSLAGFTLVGVTTTACAVPDASTTPTAASAQPPVKTDATSPQASPAKAASSTQAPAPSGLAKPQPTVELAPIIVTGEAPAYVVQDSTTATRLDTPNRDIPRDIVVIPREVIDDRAVVRADELADNVAGVTASTGYGGLSTAEYFLRGFQSQSTYRDGFRDFAFLTPIDLAGTQSVEILKGPAAALYGLNQPGGIVNILSKRPLDTPYYESEFQVGSYDFYRGSFDVSGPLVYQKRAVGER